MQRASPLPHAFLDWLLDLAARLDVPADAVRAVVERPEQTPLQAYAAAALVLFEASDRDTGRLAEAVADGFRANAGAVTLTVLPLFAGPRDLYRVVARAWPLPGMAVRVTGSDRDSVQMSFTISERVGDPSGLFALMEASWGCLPLLGGWSFAAVEAVAVGSTELRARVLLPMARSRWSQLWQVLTLPFAVGDALADLSRDTAEYQAQHAAEVAAQRRLEAAVRAAEVANAGAARARAFAERERDLEAEAAALAEAARVEAEAAADHQRGFLKAIAHEVNTPLNGVLGGAQVLAASLSPDDPDILTLQDAAERVHGSFQRLLDHLERAIAIAEPGGEAADSDTPVAVPDLTAPTGELAPGHDPAVGPSRESWMAIFAAGRRLGIPDGLVWGGPLPAELPERVSWRRFIEFNHRVIEVAGLERATRALEEAILADAMPGFSVVARLFGSPRSMVTYAASWGMPRHMPGMALRIDDAPDGRLRLVERVPDTGLDASSFYVMHTAVLSTMPALVGFPRGEVELSIEDGSATMLVRFTETRSLSATLARWMRVPFAMRSTLETWSAELKDLRRSVDSERTATSALRRVLTELDESRDRILSLERDARLARRQAGRRRRQAEAARAALAAASTARKTLLSSLAPELRTPASVVRASIARLAPRVPAEDAGWIAASGERLWRLVDCLLLLGAEDVGEAPRLVEARALIGVHDPRLVIDASGVATAPVGAVGRMITELVDNALRACRRRVRVQVCCDDALRVVIEDDGPGIPESAIHEDFRTRRGRMTRGVEGAGLGLSVARHVAASLGGELVIGRSSLGGARVEACLTRVATPALARVG